MENYPSNAKGAVKKSAPEPKMSAEDKGIRPVAAPGEAKLRKKSPGRRFKEHFLGEDAKSAVEHVFWAVLVPGIKATAANSAKDAVDRLFYGADAPPRAGTIATLASRINYAGISSSPRVTVQDPRDLIQQPQPRQGLRTTVGRVDYQDIVLSSRAMGEEAIDQMNEMISRFGKVSVADLFDMVGITGEWTDNQIGWIDLAGSRVDRVTGGYILVLPRPGQLD